MSKSDLNTKNNEEIHNHNCWSFFKAIKTELGVKIALLPPELAALVNVPNQFDASYLYRLDYTSLIHKLNETLVIDSQNSEAVDAMNGLIKTVYLNNNHLLEYTYKQIAAVVNHHTPSNSKPLNDAISDRLSSGYGLASVIYAIPQLIRSIHDLKSAIVVLGTISYSLGKLITGSTLVGTTPENESSRRARFEAFWGSEYHPMEKTGIPSLLDTPWFTSVQQIRLCTQAVREKNKPAVSRLFKKFLKAQSHQDNPQKITHLYFNLLNHDKDKSLVKAISLRHLEAGYTAELKKIEKEHPNVAIVTLPAACSLFTMKDCFNVETSKEHPLKSSVVFDNFLTIVNGKGAGITDFYISQSIREKLDESEIKNCLTNSFKAIGINVQGQDISPSQKQAIWFHFMKFELPNYLIKTLKPESTSCCCKDGIDRGGIAEAYLNLMKSFESDSPKAMTSTQFNCLVQGPAAAVKARGLNDRNFNLLWNAVDAYVQANYMNLLQNPNHQWLIEWRDLACPKKRVSELLTRNLKLIKKHPVVEPTLKPMLDEMITEIEKVHIKKNVDPSFLLEALVHTRNITSGKQMTLLQADRFAAFQAEHEGSGWFSCIKRCFNRLIDWIFTHNCINKDVQMLLKKKLRRMENEQGLDGLSLKFA